MARSKISKTLAKFIYARPRAKTISAFSSSKQVMDSLHGPNTLKQSHSIALSRLGYDIQVKNLDPLWHPHHLSTSQPSNLEKFGTSRSISSFVSLDSG
jgi:hypothetical protein